MNRRSDIDAWAGAAKREHNRVYQKQYLQNSDNKKKHLARVKIIKKKARESARQLIAEFRADGCEICGEMEPCCLSAHHIDPSEKSFDLGNASRVAMSPATVLAELDKCVCLCHNCHAKVHAGVIPPPVRG